MGNTTILQDHMEMDEFLKLRLCTPTPTGELLVVDPGMLHMF